jgi:glutathione S-transferase
LSAAGIPGVMSPAIKQREATMLFYDSVGPNPRVVRIFAAERGITLPKTTIDLRAGENRQPPYLTKNPAGQLPCLELDDGSVLAEITAICEYLDEITPGPSLIGGTPEQRAETRMWVRRIDLNIIEPMANGFRFAEGLKLFQNRIRCIPEAAADLKLTAQEKLAWLDGLVAGRRWIAGDRLTLADVMLFCFLDFAAGVGQPLDPALRTIGAQYAAMKARPSAAA